MMKTMLSLGVVVLLSGCVAQNQVSNQGKTLQAQAPGAPMHSALNAPTLISPAHNNYKGQPNPVNNAFRGAVVGGVAGNLIGDNTESTVYGAVAGGLIGYGSSL